MTVDASSLGRALFTPCQQLQKPAPCTLTFCHRSLSAIPRRKHSICRPQGSRCQLRAHGSNEQRDHSTQSAVSDESKQKQCKLEQNTASVGVIIRNVAKATAIAALVLAAVRSFLSPFLRPCVGVLLLGNYVDLCRRGAFLESKQLSWDVFWQVVQPLHWCSTFVLYLASPLFAELQI